ncbi:DENN domain-containing protein 2C, partial [Eschrichtius robustus]|nr:DENN domain-containing protein 2C [Eschrichtius robustus]
PTKENPYEDIPVQPLPMWRSPSTWKLPPPKSAFKAPKLPSKPQFFHRKTMELKSSQVYLRSKLTRDTTLPVTLTEWKLFRAGEVANRKRKNLPRVSVGTQNIGPTAGPPGACENLHLSKYVIALTSRYKRIAQLQQSSKRNPHYQTLERDLIEFQEQQLFELFVVVSLQKKPSEISYIPQIIQQFPSKGDHGIKQSRDTEERLKVIPKFCFPDSKDWVPTSELKSETFSFVLTGEDGSRWFGYCKKLLSIELCRPLDSRLEHVDFECLFKCLSVCHLIRVCASLLLERRIIFVANSLSTLSKCGHAVVATLYPFTWQHTYIPVLPASMIDIVCSPTPFLIGILSCSLPQLQDLPIEE